jgi:hypothetical protein
MSLQWNEFDVIPLFAAPYCPDCGYVTYNAVNAFVDLFTNTMELAPGLIVELSVFLSYESTSEQKIMYLLSLNVNFWESIKCRSA